jgi:hypothetical protein
MPPLITDTTLSDWREVKGIDSSLRALSPFCRRTHAGVTLGSRQETTPGSQIEPWAEFGKLFCNESLGTLSTLRAMVDLSSEMPDQSSCRSEKYSEPRPASAIAVKA